MKSDDVWDAFAGRGVHTGAFARAQWHASCTGVALHTGSKKAMREPEAVNLRAWLRTYSDLHAAKDHVSRGAFLKILSDCLVANPGTPIVERWLGEVKLLELKHRAHKLGAASVEHCLKVLKQDDRGRRLTGDVLDPKALLVKSASGQTSKGVHVVLPASKFLISAQKVFRELYGSRTLICRDLTPLSTAQQSARRHIADKPPLGRIRPRSTKSVAAAQIRHTAGVQGGIAALAGGARDGVLGLLPRFEREMIPSSSRQMIAAVQDATVARIVARPIAAAAGSGTGKRPLHEDDETGVCRVAKQPRILKDKHASFTSAPSGSLPAYVGPKGDKWRPEACGLGSCLASRPCTTDVNKDVVLRPRSHC